MARAILKTGNTILKTQGKIFQVGDIRPPVLDLNPALLVASDNDKISRFSDSSDYRNHAIMEAEGNQGTFKTNAINGFPVIEMDGVNNYYILGTAVIVKTAFLIIRNTSAMQNNYNPIFSGISGPSSDYFDSPGTAQLFRAYENLLFADSAGNKLFINGGEVNPITLAQQQQYFRLLSIDVGANVNISITQIAHRAVNAIEQNHWKGQIGRIIVFNYRLPSIARKEIEQELITQYAL